jgi:UDP-N-acetylmuramate dehydrogenase
LNESILDELKVFLREDQILISEPMSRHTTFRCGGPAALFLQPLNRDQLVRCVKLLRDGDEPFFLLGNGSNLLVSDKGYEGCIIQAAHLDDISLEHDTQIRVECGALNSAVASFAKEKSLTGFEFAAGIPGTIGGAMIMNAGAYGGEMKDITVSVTAIAPSGEEVTISGSDCEFAYRTSRLKSEGFIVTGALLELEKGNPEDIQARMTELALKRKEKQPLEYPSAGSTFKRPEGYFAGKLIEDAGLRGFTVGGAQVSEKHCGFVINKGNATSTDVYNLICEVKKRVLDASGVELEPEVILLGNFS